MAEKKEKSSEALSSLQKKYGAGVVIPINQSPEYNHDVNYVSTGSLVLDRLIAGKKGQCLGIPLDGKVTQIVADNNCGKSTLAYSVAKNATEKGRVLLLDLESSASVSYLQDLGVDVDKVDVINTSVLLGALGVKDRTHITIEEIGNFLVDVLKSQEYILIIWDSISSAIPLSESRTEKDLATNSSANSVAGVARSYGKVYRQLSAALKGSHAGVILLNQWRNTMDMYSPRIASGGKSLGFLLSLDIALSRSLDRDNDKDRSVNGFLITAKIQKSKLADGFGKTQFYLTLDQGIDWFYDAFTILEENKYIVRGGAWYSIYEEPFIDGLNPVIKLQGEDNTLEYLRDNEDFTKELIKKLLN